MTRDPTAHTAYCQSVPSRNAGVARDKREERLVSLVYLVCLVCVVEPDRLNRPDEPDQPSVVSPVSPVPFESGIGGCNRSLRELCGGGTAILLDNGTHI